MIKLNLSAEPGESLTLQVNGETVLEHHCGYTLGPDQLMAKVNRARRLEALPVIFRSFIDRVRTIVNIEDHINTRPVAKQQQFVRGFNDGLHGATDNLHERAGIAGVPPVPPDHTHSYRAGYEYGVSLFRALEDINKADKSQD